jgi:4-hydroxy-tetrahydrodipicolinate synthase
MILPPSFMPASDAEMMAYYQAISKAVSIPIFLQDVPHAAIGPGLARRIAETCEQVRYIKVESLPITAKITAMKAEAGDLLTIFGGAGGGYFVEELRRGSVGTMPFCSQPEAFVKIWNLYEAGDECTAMEVFNRLLVPIARVAGQGAGIFYHVHKELLRHRGIIDSATVRGPAPAIEPQTQHELAAILDELYPSSLA